MLAETEDEFPLPEESAPLEVSVSPVVSLDDPPPPPPPAPPQEITRRLNINNIRR